MVVMVPGGQGSEAIHRHWGGRRVSDSAHSPRHSSQSPVGLTVWAPRGCRVVLGGVAQGGPP